MLVFCLSTSHTPSTNITSPSGAVTHKDADTASDCRGQEAHAAGDEEVALEAAPCHRPALAPFP